MTATLFVAALIVVVPILLVGMMTLWRRFKHKKKTAEIHSQLQKIARENNLHLSASLVVKGQVLGIDGLRRKLIFAKINLENQLVWEIIDLDSIKECSLYKSQDVDRTPQVNKKSFYIKELGVRLHFNYDRDPVDIVFYQHIVDYLHNLPEAEISACEWETTICKQIINANSNGRYRALA